MICASAKPPGRIAGVVGDRDAHRAKARLRIDDRRNLPDIAGDAAVCEPTGVTLAGMPRGRSARSCCDSCACISICPPSASRNSAPRARADDLTDLDIAGENQAGRRRDDVQAGRFGREWRRSCACATRTCA